MTDQNRPPAAEYAVKPDDPEIYGHWSGLTGRFHAWPRDPCIFCERDEAARPPAPELPPPDPNAEPGFLQSMRMAAVQRPRTQFVKISWATLQVLLNERDALWQAASDETKARIKATHHQRNYGYQPPPAYSTPRYRKDP